MNTFIKDDVIVNIVNTFDNQLAQEAFASILMGDVEGYKALTHARSDKWLPSVIGDNTYNGVLVNRIGMTSKVEMTCMSNDGFLGKNYEFNVSKDVPMLWFSRDYYTAIIKQIKFFIIDDDADAPLAVEFKPTDVLYMMLAMVRNSRTREFWNARLSTLVDYPNYSINCLIAGELEIVPSEVHSYGIKEEHALKGFYKTPDLMETENNPFVHYVENGTGHPAMYSFEAPKKAFARVSRLVETPKAISIGMHKVFVAKDIPDGIKEWFVSGSAYVPTPLLEKYGTIRATNEYGLKFTSALMPKSCSHDSWIITSKASFKGGLNGLYLACNPGLSIADMLSLSEEDVLFSLEPHEAIIDFEGYAIEGYFIDTEVNVSDFYCLHGLRRSGDESKTILVEHEGEDVELEVGSYYLEAREAVASDLEYDLISDIQAKLSEGTLKYRKDSLNLKMQEFTNARFSYGAEVGDEWMMSVIRSAFDKGMRGHMTESLDRITGDIDCEVYTKQDIFNVMVNNVFQGMRKVPTGRLSPDAFIGANGYALPLEEYYRRVMVLLHGLRDQEGNVLWSGLLSDAPKKILVDGHEFYIPSGKTMREFISQEEGSVGTIMVEGEPVDLSRIFLSGPAGAFILLIIAIKNKYTNWNLKCINHDVDMQKAMLGDTIDNWNVDGGSYVMLPAPWLEMDEVTLIQNRNRGWSLNDGDRVTFSKMPVLFDKAVSDMRLRRHIPKSIFGKLTKKLVLALRPAAYCNIDIMLDHQNDTDGDQCRISTLGGILPLYDGPFEHMSKWTRDYTADEYELELRYKPYSKYPHLGISGAVFEAMTSKQEVGTFTNMLMYVSNILDYIDRTSVPMAVVCSELRAYTAMLVQDCVVRSIKHEGTVMNHSICTTRNLFTNNDLETREEARAVYASIIGSIAGSDMSFGIDMFFAYCDQISDKNGVNTASSRRAYDILNIDLEQSEMDNVVKMKDIVTRSYINAVVSAAPNFSNTKIEKRNAKQSIILANVADYYDKYILSGQNLASLNVPTTMGIALRNWADLTTREYETMRPTESELRSVGVSSIPAII